MLFMSVIKSLLHNAGRVCSDQTGTEGVTSCSATFEWSSVQRERCLTSHVLQIALRKRLCFLAAFMSVDVSAVPEAKTLKAVEY